MHTCHPVFIKRSRAQARFSITKKKAPADSLFGPEIYKAVVPEQLGFVSYPYEWSFDELKDAALLTLDIQQTALAHGMSLKDASAFNVQFRGARPVFIDLLSFERDGGGPWIAYEQFCRQFLGPLLLMQHCSAALRRYGMADLAGPSLEVVSRLLPARSYLNLDALIHIHLHQRAQKRHDAIASGKARSAQRPIKAGLANSLRTAVEKISLRRGHSQWSQYYEEQEHYSPEALQFKADTVRSLVGRLKPALVYDFGANTGRYSREAARAGARCVAFDIDPLCVNDLYLSAKKAGESRLLPLVMDLLNPSPGLGLALRERMSLTDRGCPDLVMLLAVLHHLRITGQAPLLRIAEFLSTITSRVLVEFVPKSDPMIRLMLRDREDTFDDWTPAGFLQAFGRYFHLNYTGTVPGTDRSLFLFTGGSAGRAAERSSSARMETSYL